MVEKGKLQSKRFDYIYADSFSFILSPLSSLRSVGDGLKISLGQGGLPFANVGGDPKGENTVRLFAQAIGSTCFQQL